jgi:hypothetical protein
LIVLSDRQATNPPVMKIATMMKPSLDNGAVIGAGSIGREQPPGRPGLRLLSFRPA